MIKKCLALLVGLAAAVSALGGCGAPAESAGGGAAAASPAQNAPAAETAAPVEITAVLQLNPEIVLENNPMVAAIEEKLNIRLQIEAPPQDGYGDRVKMLVSTGDMPDLVHYGADIFATQWSEEGLTLDVTDLIAKYPNLSANISEEQYGDCVFLDDGRIYGIPKPNSYDKFGYVINKKWLDTLGLKAPITVEEFIEVCRAFTFNDPDGNGQADTFGASFNAQKSSMDSGIWHLHNDFLSMAYSISSWHAGMPDADGSAKLRSLKSLYPDYIQLIRSLYEEGIIDREFITHGAEENYEKFAQNRVGIVGASEKSYVTNLLEKYLLNLDDYVYCPPLVLKTGDKPVYAMPPSNWMAYYVNAQSSPEKQDAALRVLDYANSEEGFVLMQLGIAGANYNSYDIETRAVERTDEQFEASRKVTSNMFAMANAYRNAPVIQGGSTPEGTAKWLVEARAADAATTKCYFAFTKMLDEIGIRFPDEVTALNSLEVRYVTGEAQFSELAAYINDVYAPATADIAKAFADYMADNPARYVD
ncbi:MAG: extracellular solute-binding protein [Clostridiales bacterium]|nr:extracellular solute-binding protein [Clostridiales bacterium]